MPPGDPSRARSREGRNSEYFPNHDSKEVSGARDFHPRALPEPDMNLSIHPAPIVQP